MRTINLLSNHNVTDIFTAVYVLVDDYLQASESLGRFKLPKKSNQKASYAELLSIVLVGEILQQKNQGLWYLLVKSEYQALFPKLPSLSRFYRIQRNFERIYADFTFLLAQHASLEGVYVIDSKPLPICKGKRYKRPRRMIEAVSGRGGVGGFFYGFKLHALTSKSGYICRFAIVSANENDATVARALLDEHHDDLNAVLGDKAYKGLGIHTPPKANAKQPEFWSGFFTKARMSIETVFSCLTRTKNLCLQQLNSFSSVRASVCRKLAAHNLTLFLFN